MRKGRVLSGRVHTEPISSIQSMIPTCGRSLDGSIDRTNAADRIYGERRGTCYAREREKRSSRDRSGERVNIPRGKPGSRLTASEIYRLLFSYTSSDPDRVSADEEFRTRDFRPDK